MAEDEGVVEVEAVGDSPAPSRGSSTVGTAKRLAAMPLGMTRRVMAIFRRRSRRDQLVIGLGILIIIAVLLIALGGGGGGGDGDGGPEYVDNWSLDGLSNVTMEETLEHMNLEGQTSKYFADMEPNASEVMFVERIWCHVEWNDESSPPSQVPSVGYDTNEPDGFMLTIRLQNGEVLSSPLVFNSQGQTGTVDLEMPLNETIAVANPQGAKYLPRDSYESFRVEFWVYTDECGDWPSPRGIRPPIGDGGNAFTFDWHVQYLLDGDGRP